MRRVRFKRKEKGQSGSFFWLFRLILKLLSLTQIIKKKGCDDLNQEDRLLRKREIMVY